MGLYAPDCHSPRLTHPSTAYEEGVKARSSRYYLLSSAAMLRAYTFLSHCERLIPRHNHPVELCLTHRL